MGDFQGLQRVLFDQKDCHTAGVDLLNDAKKLGDKLIVIVNNDEQVKIKGSTPFMPESERMEIIKALNCVDEVFLSVDKDITIAKSLEHMAQKYPGELYFAKGGDRNINNIPQEEKEICQKFGIKVIGSVGGQKVQSSSWLIKNVINKI